MLCLACGLALSSAASPFSIRCFLPIASASQHDFDCGSALRRGHFWLAHRMPRRRHAPHSRPIWTCGPPRQGYPAQTVPDLGSNRRSYEFIPAWVARPAATYRPASSGMLPMASTETRIRPAPEDIAASEALAGPCRLQLRGKTINRCFRIRLQPPAGAKDYSPGPGVFRRHPGRRNPAPADVWNELGTELMQSAPLGQGLGLPSSETLARADERGGLSGN